MNHRAFSFYSPNSIDEPNFNPVLFPEQTHASVIVGFVTLTDTALADLAEMISDRDPGVLRDLVEVFLSEATRQLQNMLRGIRENDLSLLFLPAHSLKSSAATFGALRLAQLSEKLEEEFLGACDKGVLGPLVQQIEAEYPLVATAMQNALTQWRE